VEKLRQLGHEIIILFGDFTAQIGDPTDKGAARIRLTKKQVSDNIKNWEKQISKIVDLNNKTNPIKIVKNSSWLSKMSFQDVIDLSANFTVQQMIERDMFQKRLTDNKPIYVHEFFYPLMQGYDSVHLDVDLEIGGTDQTFNMLAGRTLLSKIKNKEKFVMVNILLEDPETGKKLMSKSEGDAIYVNDSAEEMFGKTMSLKDSAIIPMLIGITRLELDKIKEIEKSLAEGLNPKEAKVLLAKEIVKMYYGEKIANQVEENFAKTFSKKEGMPDDTQEIKIEVGAILVDELINEKIISSKGEWRRLVLDGAVSDLISGDKITEPNFAVQKDLDLKIGKKKFLKIRI
jgi:tyrosyl-tRNA synthetase